MHICTVGFDGDKENFSSARNSLVEIDLGTGAATPINLFGDFDTKLTLLDTDGSTELATNVEAEFAWGQRGSNPDYGNTRLSLDAYLEYDFVTPGTYYIQVNSVTGMTVPFGGTYSLSVSIPGGLGEFIFNDSFE